MSAHLIIVGAGQAAAQTILTLLQKRYPGRITVVGDEPYPPYQRPPLSKRYLSGELERERLFVRPAEFYEQHGVTLILGAKAERLEPVQQRLTLADGRQLDYDRLLLATGSRVRKIDVPGAELPGIHYLRTIADADGILGGLGPDKRLVIVGAGYIGLEVAAVASLLGTDVTVIEMENRVMSRVVSPKLSAFYQKEHTEHGVKLRLSTGISGFSGNGRVTSVDLANGDQVATDLVVIGIGVVPNTELASDAGLDVNNGIVVDDHCRTSDPDIFAVGDCTHHPNDILGRRVRLESVHNALEQAKTAASNICGDELTYAQVPWFWSDQYDIKLQIAGLSQGYDQTILRGDPESRSFSCLYLCDGALIAVDAVNSPKDFMQSKALIAAHAVIDPELLGNPDLELKNMFDT